MDEAEAEASETVELVEPSEPVIIKKRGRPKGSLNKKTIAKLRQDVLPEDAQESSILEREEDTHDTLSPMVLDVDFTSDEILGEKPQASPKSVKRKPRATPKTRDPPTEPPSEEDSPPPTPSTRKRPTRVKTRSDKYRASFGGAPPPQEPIPETVNPPSYLEVLTRGLKEARAKQYAEKVAQYDRFFQW